MSSAFDDPSLYEEGDSRQRRAARGALLWRGSWEPLESWPFDEPPELGDPFVGDDAPGQRGG
ncbi:MAG: hypothetical protein RBU21_19400 [FCB group bacterium]|nr:hypothetical protein [FCB group bacterium]